MTHALRWCLLALLGWWTFRFAASPLDGHLVAGSFLHLVNLPFHEAGHMLFAPFGAFMTALGGSLLQLLIPAVCAVSFARRQDHFAAWVCVWWFGQNLIDLAPYIADARALQLVLLGGMTGAEVEGHDWEAILGHMGWLHFDRRIGMTAHFLGSLTMLTAIVAAGWCARPGETIGTMKGSFASRSPASATGRIRPWTPLRVGHRGSGRGSWSRITVWRAERAQQTALTSQGLCPGRTRESPGYQGQSP